MNLNRLFSSSSILSRAFSTAKGTVHIKHKTPQKRASSLYTMLKKEEFEGVRNGRQWPPIRAGDSIEVEVFGTLYLIFLSLMFAFNSNYRIQPLWKLRNLEV